MENQEEKLQAQEELTETVKEETPTEEKTETEATTTDDAAETDAAPAEKPKETTEVVASEEPKAETPEAETPEAAVEEIEKEEKADAAKKEEAKAEAQPPAKEKPKSEPKKPSSNGNVGGDFDWDDLADKGFGDQYDDKEKKELEDLYGGTINEITEKEVIKGTVVGITDRDVILNIGFKSDGLVSASEFRDVPDLKIGDEVEVYVEEQENVNGQLVLSRRKAKIVNAWEKIQDSHDKDSVIDGFVKRRTKGGLIVDIFGIEAFLPGSQIDVKPIRDFDVFVNKKMEVKVVKINYTNDNVVVSHKVLIEKDLEAQKTEILNNLEKGQVLEGVIKNMTNFGVFIDLGGVDGLLHITDISWGRINHPEEVLNLDDKVNVVVLDFDDDKKRISLGMKQLTEHPWDSLDAKVEVGSKVKGKIVNVADYGAFLEIKPGVEGLIHVSEMSWSQHLRNPADFVSVGDDCEAVVLTIDREERKMSLGIKQLTEDPWTKNDMISKYAVGTDHSGVVRNLTNFGLFLELEEGIDGLVHVSDLSWTKKIKHPSEFVKVGDELQVRVLELDVENRRLALGHKQLEENPWETFESVFEQGSLHKCTIISKTDKVAILELPYGIEGTSSLRNLKKEDGTMADVGETLEFKVIDFAKDDKRITLSHSHVHSTPKEEPKQKKTSRPSKTLDKINKDVEKSTLGDIAALSELKTQMEDASDKAKKDDKAKKETKADKAEAVKEAPKAETKKKVAAKKTAKKKEEKEDSGEAKESKTKESE
ncbi:MAG: 30S ribosomal protein S1 [Cyclobacteriaceae bacterium]